MNTVTTSIEQPRFGNLSKFLPFVHMKISNPDSDLATVPIFKVYLYFEG